MHQPATTPIGPPGSTIHVLHADAGAIAELAATDWNRHFRRVRLDPARGLASPIAPSTLHEDLTRIFDDVVGVAGSTPAGASKGLRSPRLRGRGEPPGAGMEPDRPVCAGERASGRYAALAEGEAAPDTFVERTAPDLVVEVEITHTDAGKAERYGETGGGSRGGCTGARARGSCGRSSSPEGLLVKSQPRPPGDRGVVPRDRSSSPCPVIARHRPAPRSRASSKR